ncbi:DENN domain-containing protein 1B [Amphibalanus amphitrite]|uniref:DENN domain-containing protein 1B n=1 Tax=Amphibalanus amphitrite TaxID=1232801 RepID=A0A6A4WK34_AMPAM|nr:DENN domain-containing protein 1B [Amphibalanus amphitrite]KAF0303013.1 DENN domain-containing protein 1B [Amphibalanus amphitrite]
MSLLRENVQHVFDCFCDVPMPPAFANRMNADDIRLKFPNTFVERNTLNMVPKFAYPCVVESTAVEHFSFVLRREDKWLFGFCRRSPTESSTLVLLSALPWHDLMYKLLDKLHEVLSDGGEVQLRRCLNVVYRTPVPAGGETLRFPLPDGTDFAVECPDRRRRPALLVDRNLTEYYAVLDNNTKLELFAALLHERHVLITSSRLGRLSACVHAAQELLYPLQWQRLFFPVVPAAHRGLLASPVAFLAGCPAVVRAQLSRDELPEEYVELDADCSRLRTPHGDLQRLPADLVASLRRQLNKVGSIDGDGDSLARAFQTAVLRLVDGYRHGFRRDAAGAPLFDRTAFLESQPSSRRPFLQTLAGTQMFEQFIQERLARPESSGDSLLREPAYIPPPESQSRRPWIAKMMWRRRLSGSGRTASESSQRRPQVAAGAAGTSSAPASPVTQRLRPTGVSSPCLLPGALQRRTTTAGSGGSLPRPNRASLWTEPSAEDDPLAGFSVMGGSSLLDEINAELQLRSQQLAEMDDVSLLRRGTSAPSGHGGGGSDQDDVFSEGASGPRGARRSAANGRPPLPGAGRRGGSSRL